MLTLTVWDKYKKDNGPLKAIMPSVLFRLRNGHLYNLLFYLWMFRCAMHLVITSGKSKSLVIELSLIFHGKRNKETFYLF